MNGKYRNMEMNDNTPLHIAVINSDIEKVKMLLDKGAEVNAKNNIENTALFYAIEKADVNLTKLLLSNRANIKDNPGLLINAVEKNCLEIVEALVHYDVDINTIDSNGRTALHFTVLNEMPDSRVNRSIEDSIVNAKAEIVKILLSKGANVNAKTNSGLTVLHMAAQNRYKKVVEILLEYNADINTSDKFGRTALHFSAICEIRNTHFYFINKSEHKTTGEIAKLLLGKGANVDAETQIGQTTLHLAAENGYVTVVKALLQYNADINVVDEWDRTALHFTALDDFRRDFSLILSTADIFINTKSIIASLILGKGANINAQTDKGLTTLHAATEVGFLPVVEALLEFDADINVCDVYGLTALHYTVVKRSQRPVTDNDIDIKTQIAKLLISQGANVNARTKTGSTALHAATKRGLLDVVKVLLEHDADINDFDRNGITALHYTMGKENLFIDNDHEIKNVDVQAKIAKMLLSYGADINAKTRDGETALHIATVNSYTEIIEMLLEHNANVNCRSSNGFTPLHFAAENDFPEIVNILLKFGADVNSVDECGRTALYIASVKNHLNVVTTLLDYGTKFNFIRVHYEIYLASDLDESNYANIDPFYSEYDPDYCIYPKCYCLVEQTLDIYKREVIKLEVANLYVNKNNLELLRCDNMTQYKEKCEKEIAIMKYEKIDNSNISFYDIIVKDTTLLAKCMRNDNIVRVLKAKYYETKFPVYAEKITCNFGKAMHRKELQEKGIQIFNFFFNTPELPHNCIEKIVNYLNSEDVKTLFNACKYNQRNRWNFTRSSYL